ncbi:M24 family metallopeptidase C-terminal domain-containing protein [Brevundimonas vesicularis]
MLTPQERAYVDNYHAEVLANVGPLLAGGVQKDEAALEWLKVQTRPL